jgi:hypothetical protein
MAAILRALMICAGVVALSSAPLRRGARADKERFVIIAHPGVPVQRVEVDALRDLFLRRVRTLDGAPAVPINLPPHSEWRRRFEAAVLRMEPAQVGRYWVDFRIRGHGTPPRTVPTPEIMVRVVSALRGAVGYAPASVVEGSQVKRLQVLGLKQP